MWLVFSYYFEQLILCIGARPYGLGHMGNAQYTTVSGRINVQHTPSVVCLICVVT